MRKETDALGTIEIEDNCLYGINTQRAIENFIALEQPVFEELVKALAMVKLACANTNQKLGYLNDTKASVIKQSCEEIIAGKHFDYLKTDALQGGAGTSTNMNINEVIANVSINKLNGEYGNYDIIHPLHDVNMHQSTNDVYPTAVKVAVLYLLKSLENEVSKLQEELQYKEQEFNNIIKVGRTQLQDAVPMTLGMEFGAFAEAVSRDRWRIFKCRERIKQVNLGGTAIGTGIGAPKDYILKVVNELRDITGLNISRAENLVDATQNTDSFVEVSGILKAYASNLIKISNDLRLLSSGPNTSIAEIKLPEMQAGSSIMAGKVNPVIPEMVVQLALKVIANDSLITNSSFLSNLELCQLMPLLAHSMIETLKLLINSTKALNNKCIKNINPNIDKCHDNISKSTMIATMLVPFIGYKKVEEIINIAKKEQKNIKEVIVSEKILTAEKIEEILSPKRLAKLGFDDTDKEFFK